jgi:hypothetical protein
MTTMQSIVVFLLFFSAVNTRTGAINGAAINCGAGTVAKAKTKTKEHNAGGMTLAQLEVIEKDIYSTMFRVYGVTYELMELEKDALETVRKELAALENEPGISNYEYKKRRLQEKQKRMVLEIAVTDRLKERLAVKLASTMWRRFCSRIVRFFSLS